jgi:acyl dehydratase
MALSASTLAVGDSRTETLVEDLSRTQIVMYAGASGDYNPVHTDEVFVTKVAGYPTVFAHGMLSMGMTGRLLTDWVGDGRLTRYGVRFVKQVWPGDSLTATATVTALRTEEGDNPAAGEPVADFEVVTRNQHGDVVVSGYATARLDP